MNYLTENTSQHLCDWWEYTSHQAESDTVLGVGRCVLKHFKKYMLGPVNTLATTDIITKISWLSALCGKATYKLSHVDA